MTDAPAPKPPVGFARAWRDNVEAIVVAFTFALIIRCFFLEVFQIPTTSMEPTLLGDIQDARHPSGAGTCPFFEYHGGDSSSGDRIMVTKFTYGLSKIERFDVVVFKYPLNIARNFIKRVVGLPDEQFLIYNGNIYTSPGRDGKKEEFKIMRKPREAQKRLWIRVDPGVEYLKSKESFIAWEAGQGSFNVRDGYLQTMESDGSRRSWFRHGRVKDYPDRSVPVDDLRLAMDLEMDAQGTFKALIENQYGRFEVVLFGKKGSVFVFKDVTGKERTHDLGIAADPGKSHTLELDVFDGRYFVRYDGKDLISMGNEFIKTRADAEQTQDANEAAFGSEDSTYTIKNLFLGRDVHYKCRQEGENNIAEDKPLYIPPGNYLVMGDNTAYSQDSRAWQQVTVWLKDGREIIFEKDKKTLGFSEKSDRPIRLQVTEDRYGDAVTIYEDEYLNEEVVDHPFVAQDYIVGRALWIWFPPNRWFRLIR